MPHYFSTTHKKAAHKKFSRFLTEENKVIFCEITMADIGLVLRKQQSKLGEALSKKTHFTIAEIENLLTLYRLFFVRSTHYCCINMTTDCSVNYLQVQYVQKDYKFTTCYVST